jgi:ABC-type oligopeptide transport system ATPase subunit
VHKVAQKTILEVSNLKQVFTAGKHQSIKAVDGISFKVYEGEIFGLVGESGSGKSTTGKSILQMNKPTAGQVHFQGLNLTDAQVYQAHKNQIRRDMQLIFQDSASALNPRMTLRQIIEEPLVLQKMCRDKRERLKKVIDLMALVGLEENLLTRHPYECSGGQRQRIAIARALSVEPKLLIADEPIASLDVSLQAQVVNLLMKLQKEQGLSCLLISHDLEMVMHICQRIAVMHRGKIVEIGESEQIKQNPQHAYTKALRAAMLIPDPAEAKKQRLDLSFESGIEVNYDKGELKEVSKGHYVYLQE